MRTPLKLFLSSLTLIFITSSSSFAASESEKDFIDRYKKAFEAKDSATLESLLYTKGADPDALDFYKMMLTEEMGSKISSIELLNLTPEEAKKASGTMPSLDGGESKLPVAPTKKLVLKIESVEENKTSSSTSQSFVAEVDGKLVIPVPMAVGK